jgi:DNA gyrase subunit A
MLALSGSQPKQMPLRDILEEFISFREITLTRRYSYELNQAQDRLHIVEGLVTILAAIDEVIEIFRHSADTAQQKLVLPIAIPSPMPKPMRLCRCRCAA